VDDESWTYGSAGTGGTKPRIIVWQPGAAMPRLVEAPLRLNGPEAITGVRVGWLTTAHDLRPGGVAEPAPHHVELPQGRR
jgi:hypothetical protein